MAGISERPSASSTPRWPICKRRPGGPVAARWFQVRQVRACSHQSRRASTRQPRQHRVGVKGGQHQSACLEDAVFAVVFGLLDRGADGAAESCGAVQRRTVRVLPPLAAQDMPEVARFRGEAQPPI